MASSSTTGVSSGSMNNTVNSSGSDQDDQVHMVDQRKRKRMLSNRESARRSRMRKQKHLDDLVSQVGELKKDNSQILTSINITTQLYVRVDAENSILRAQMAELTNRLQSLNDIINCINISTNNCVFENIINEDINHVNHLHNNIINQISLDDHDDHGLMNMNNPWNSIPMNQPIMASSDHHMYMY